MYFLLDEDCRHVTFWEESESQDFSLYFSRHKTLFSLILHSYHCFVMFLLFLPPGPQQILSGISARSKREERAPWCALPVHSISCACKEGGGVCGEEKPRNHVAHGLGKQLSIWRNNDIWIIAYCSDLLFHLNSVRLWTKIIYIGAYICTDLFHLSRQSRHL